MVGITSSLCPPVLWSFSLLFTICAPRAKELPCVSGESSSSEAERTASCMCFMLSRIVFFHKIKYSRQHFTIDHPNDALCSEPFTLEKDDRI